MAFSGLIDATTPIGSEQRNLADDYMRAIKVAFQERLAIEHSCADNANDGRHLLSTKFHLTGTYAAIPAVDAAYPGRLYWSTNASTTVSPAVYYDTGTAWTKIATSDHGCLAGLTDDDHPQYGLADGTRAFAILAVTGAATIGGTLGVTGNVTFSGYFVSNLSPSVTNNCDLGTDTLRWRDLWLSRDAYISRNLTVGGQVNSNLNPGVNCDLGTDTLRWRNLYATGLNLAGYYVYSNLVPSTTESFDLGASGNKWRDAYIGRNLTVGGQVNSNLNPGVNCDLGTDTLRWRDLWLSGNVTAGGLMPKTGTCDIGASGNKWRDLWLSGNAYIGGTLGVTGAAILESSLYVKGDTTLGDATTDTMICTAKIGSNLVPSGASFDVGSPSFNWRRIYLSSTVYCGGVESTGTITSTSAIYAESIKRVACGGGSTGTITEGTINNYVTLEINGTLYYLLRWIS